MPTPGALELFTEAAGSALSLFGGGRLTRLTLAAEPGDTTLTVERAAGLPSSGLVSLGRITYAFSGIAGTQLTGIVAQQGGTSTPGVVSEHPALTPVLDVSGTYSELDGLYASLFVPTATGEDLAVLARNLGCPRPESLRSDAQLRSVIHATAYVPRGTFGALRSALDAILGSQKYGLVTNPFTDPGVVTVVADQANFTSNSSIGATYLARATPRTPAADGTFTLPAPCFGHGRLTLEDVQLNTDCRALLPSALAPWVRKMDDERKACRIVPQGAGSTSSQADLTGVYATALPACPSATISFVATIGVDGAAGLATSPGTGCGGQVDSGIKTACWGIWATSQGSVLGLLDTSGNSLTPPVPFPSGIHSVGLRLSPSGAQLRLDGVVVARCAVAALPAGATPQVRVGNLYNTSQPGSGGVQPQLRLRHLDILLADPTEYGNLRGTAATSAPNQLALPAASPGQQVWLTRSKASNAAGGNNNGRYLVVQALGGQALLAGEMQSGGATSKAAGVSSFTAPTLAFRFPDDLGKRLVLTGGGSGVDGTYTIAKLLDPANGRDLATYATRLPTRASRAVLSGGAPLAAGSLSWQLNPAFVAESAITYQLASAAQVATQADGSQVLTPPAPLPSLLLPYILPADQVLGGTLQDTHDVTNAQVSAGPPPKFSRYPFYLSDPLDALEAFLPDLVAAGVEARIRYR